MLGQKPRNDARIGNHRASTRTIAQIIANEAAQLILQEAMNRARRRHRARLAIDLQADFLYGDGIGRYGTSQLPDVAIKPTGILAPIPEFQALTGLIGHPTDALDFYVYAGIEQAAQTSFTIDTLPFGYGNPLYNNSGCLHEGSTLCAENTSRVWQVASGAWYSLYNGSYGTLRIGAQGSYTRRYIFTGIGGFAKHGRRHVLHVAAVLPSPLNSASRASTSAPPTACRLRPPGAGIAKSMIGPSGTMPVGLLRFTGSQGPAV